MTAALAALRDANARHARIARHLRAVHQLGPRPTFEMIVEFATDLGGLPELERIAARYASRLDASVLHQVGGDRFPLPPFRVVSRG